MTLAGAGAAPRYATDRAALPAAAADRGHGLSRLQPARRGLGGVVEPGVGVVRSSLSAGQPATPSGPDLPALARQVQVDAVVTGSLLRAGNDVRVSAQLVAVPEGSLLWSHTIQAPIHDLFQLQDALTHAIVSALHVPLTAHDHRRCGRTCPASAEAYELFLRANKMAADSSHWLEVRDLYERAVALDPGYARRGRGWARAARDREVRRRRPSRHQEFVRAPSVPSSARSPSIPIWRRRTICTRTSRPKPDAPVTRWCGCSPARGRGSRIRSCSPGWSPRAATAACSTSRSPRTNRCAASIRPRAPASPTRTTCAATTRARSRPTTPACRLPTAHRPRCVSATSTSRARCCDSWSTPARSRSSV